MLTTSTVKSTLLCTFLGLSSVFAQSKIETITNSRTNHSKFESLNPGFVQRDNPTNKALCLPAINCSEDDVILNVTIGSIDNTTTCSPNGYGDYRLQTTSVTAGQQTNFNITVGAGYLYEALGMWLDMNQDDQFTPSEYLELGVLNNTTNLQGSFTVPPNTAAGVYTARIMVRAANQFDPTLGCTVNNDDYGEYEDYSFQVIAAPVCSTLPTSINLSGSPLSVCPDEPINLTFGYSITSSGMSYQIQSSEDNGTTWANFGTPSVSMNYGTVQVTQSTVFRAILSCSASSNTVTSNELFVTLKTIDECYCIPELDCSDGDVISNVAVPSFNYNNPSQCGPNGYTDYKATSIGDFMVTGQYDIDVTVGSGYQYESVSIWIDYNNNGIFEPTEFTFLGTGSGSVVRGAIMIPANTPLGAKVMRVRVAAANEVGSTSDLACDELQGYGETEDYKINIIQFSSVDKNSLSNISIYPNPTKDIFTINGLENDAKIQITDLAGRIIFENDANANVDTSIDLSAFTAGSYNVVISTTAGTLVKRIIKN